MGATRQKGYEAAKDMSWCPLSADFVAEVGDVGRGFLAAAFVKRGLTLEAGGTLINGGADVLH